MPRRLGRYELCGKIGSGATSTVHLARVDGSSKLVAVKRLHPHLADDATLRAILIDEARLMSRISHPNVVAVLDVAEEGNEVFLALEYAKGATLAELLRAGPVKPAIAIAVMRDVLAGLHAAHHSRDTDGSLLGVVHRDVTPRNVIVTTEGEGKILDFGIAKARARISTTREGHVRGSLPYMAPEQLKDEPLSARTDIYGAGVVLWEALTGKRLFEGESEGAIVQRILDHRIDPPSVHMPGLPPALDAAILRALASDPKERFPAGLEMALALESSLEHAARATVVLWVYEVAGKELEEREIRAASTTETTSDDETRMSASASTEPRPPSAARSRSRGLIVGVGLLLLAFGGIALAMRSPNEPRAVTVTTTESTSVVEASVASAAPPTLESAAPPIAEPVSAPRTEPVASAITKPAPRAPTASASTKRANCTPYWVDDAGHRRFNRECLE